MPEVRPSVCASFYMLYQIHRIAKFLPHACHTHTLHVLRVSCRRAASQFLANMLV